MRQERGPSRVLRDRQSAFFTEIDRADRRVPAASARRLVSIYNGGAMPSQPNRIFLSHPVELDGTESEDSSFSADVNTSATIPVLVLQSVPQAGDLLVATAVGGRWVAERPVDNTTTICVTACYPAVPVYAATVTVLSGSTIVASGTTGSTGCITFPIAGTYIVHVQINGTLVYNSSRTLAPGGTITIAVSGTSGLVCCGGYAIPQQLTLTDAVGSLQFDYYSNYYYPIWYGGHSANLLSCSVTTPNNVCVAAAPSQGPVRVCYQMTCVAGTQPAFSIQRSWSWVYQQGTLNAIWYQDSTGFLPGQPCATSPPAACGNPHTDTSSFSAGPSSTSPFTLSGTPAAAAGNATADPVGGSIVISA